MRIKRTISCLLALCLLASAGPALAASKKKTAKTPEVKVIYNGVVSRRYANSTTSVYPKMDKESTPIKYLNPGAKISITAVYPNWVQIKDGNTIGYILRNRIDVESSVDTANTPPYPVIEHFYYACIDRNAEVKAEKKASSQTLSTLTPGARVAFIGVEDGWAKLVFKRQYGYIDTRQLSEIYPVASNIESAGTSEPIAVFTSFYKDTDDEANLNRINNLAVACGYISKTMAAGESMDFNRTVGPFNARNGYLSAPVLKDQGTKLSFGGGSCRVSSTLWDTLMQLPGITVLMRKPHGNNAASYLPHGMDASSGASNLNFKFRNDYSFPIRIDASIHDYALFVAIYKGT
ncbi:MAG: VanW family protein [Clostridiales bacterium]|nr:VanW family protein [Clostridiales bacterium]